MITKLCQELDCDSSLYAKGLCNRHYLQVRRWGAIKASVHDHRPAELKGNTAKIPLGVEAKNGYALVDIEDSWVDKYKWSRHHTGYAHARVNGKVTSLHRLLMGNPSKFIDHKNRNGLDNRRVNLRVCTHAENRRNSAKSSHNTTGYKGVVKSGKKFVARVKYFGKNISIGRHESAEEAAHTYNIMASAIHGDFANLNKVGE